MTTKPRVSKYNKNRSVDNELDGRVMDGVVIDTACNDNVDTTEEATEPVTTSFVEGDRVEKVSGYKWPGVVLCVFYTLKGEERIVVECTVPEVAGALHIYNPNQLKKTET